LLAGNGVAVWQDLARLISFASVLLLVAAALSDIAHRIIPDSISAFLALCGLAAAALHGAQALALSAAAAIVLFAALALLHARGMLGGGDVKLASAVALGLPPGGIGSFLAATACAGGVIALMHLAARPFAPRLSPARGASPLRRILAAECWRIRRRGSLPYGVAIACGGAFVLLGGN
jgi:prepilin peptidase CpaA